MSDVKQQLEKIVADSVLELAVADEEALRNAPANSSTAAEVFGSSAAVCSSKIKRSIGVMVEIKRASA